MYPARESPTRVPCDRGVGCTPLVGCGVYPARESPTRVPPRPCSAGCLSSPYRRLSLPLCPIDNDSLPTSPINTALALCSAIRVISLDGCCHPLSGGITVTRYVSGVGELTRGRRHAHTDLTPTCPTRRRLVISA